MDRGLTTRFCEPWPTFEVQTVSLFFSFSDEFWPIHWYEVMIISRRNERIQRKTKIGWSYDNFRYWTKGFVREKKKRTSEEKEDKFLQKKRERRTQRSRICSKTNSTLAQQINSKHKLHQIKQTKTQITITRIFLFKCCFFFFFLLFFLLLFLFSVDGDLSVIPLFCWILLLSMLCVLFLSCVTPFEFWIPRSLTWHALEWWKVLNF